MSCSIVFIQWGGESERESVSCPEETMAGSSTVRSGALLLVHPLCELAREVIVSCCKRDCCDGC